MYKLVIERVKKVYPIDRDSHEQVLDDISIKVKSGAFMVLYGPSGCGKSTLLNIISGLDTDYLGEVTFDNQSIKGMNDSQLTIFRKENIGFVFQNFNLISHMSVLDNILIPMYLNGAGDERNKKRAHQLLESVQLEAYAHKNVKNLSGGQKQRVSIARALANNPDIIIADEPTGSLDSVSQKNVLEILKGLSEMGKTVIVVTHDKDVASYADHVIEIKDGKLIKDYLTKEHTEKETVVKQKSGKNKFSLFSSLKIAISNFSQRKWRNIMISLATSIGITGILLSLGLGNGIVRLIENDMDGGKIPSQIQISLNTQQGSGAINKDDQNYLEKKIGKDKIKYFESPFGIRMMTIDIEQAGILDFSDTMPNYSQVVSLYQNTDIIVSANTPELILAGKTYRDPNEEGLTITSIFVDDFNEKHNLTMKPQEFIGKKINVNIVESTVQGESYGLFETVISRVIKDDSGDENSYMGPAQLEKILDNNNFTKTIPYMLLELKNPEQNEKVIESVKKNKKYVLFSQTDIVSIVINFIKIIQGLLIFMSAQAVIVSIVMIGVIMYINVIERTKEIGVMKAVGYKNKEINLIFSSEAFLITFLSLLLSIIFASLLGIAINTGVSLKFPKITGIFSLGLNSLFYTTILAFTMSLLSSAMPMLKVGKLDPARSLRYE